MAGQDDPLRGAERALAAVIERARAAEKTDFACVRTGRRWRLELWGSLPPSWAGHLSLHCTSVGLDIAEGLAWRVAASRWAASFVLSPARSRADLRAFDFARMARRRPTGATQAGLPRLDAFTLERSVLGGGVRAMVRGRDEPGFLAAVLARFALFGLHPSRFAIGSEGDRAVDWFLLQTAFGKEPAPQSVAALRGALGDCLPGAAAAPNARGGGA